MKLSSLSKWSIFIGILFITFFACRRDPMKNIDVNFPLLKAIPQEKWQTLANKKIFFGHKSVGDNLVNGLEDILKYIPEIKLDIIRTSELSDFDHPLLAHAYVGENGDPGSKNDAFTHLMESGLGEKVDIAFFKYCYADIKRKTDVDKVFNAYKKSMDYLITRYINTVFIPVTVPLHAIQSGPKAWIKKIIRRPLNGVDDNIKRCRFNELLRQWYQGKVPIFDLARIESTALNNKRKKFQKGETVYYSLVRKYTYDGKHLNQVGRITAAEQLLALLAGL